MAASPLRASRDPRWRFVSRQFLYACQLDVRALKPGNVGLHGGGRGKTAADYRRSAQAAAEPLTRPDAPLGRRILDAARATFDVVGCNTNLGVLLLAAPLAAACHRPGGGSLEARLAAVLAAADRDDADDAYRAIRLLNPGGLGRAAAGDVRERARLPLRAAMALARERDQVAAEYADGFPVVLGEARPLWRALRRRWGDESWAMTGVFLTLLARRPDTHVARTRGAAAAARISGKIGGLAADFCGASAPEEHRQRLLDLDASWKSAGISPGTSADLTLCGVFAARLGDGSGDGGMGASSGGSDSPPTTTQRKKRE